ncbi:MAG: diguanylate cyclase [Anaerolineales bacterium]|nr:diguanylate cyclase [Anaerolineales bacterium]
MKILVYDGDIAERLAIQQSLEKAGHEVLLAENSQAVLQQVESGEVQMVVSDQNSLGPENKSLVQIVRSAQVPTRIYLILMLDKGKDAASAVMTGPDDILSKPISTVELKSRVIMAERILTLEKNLVEAREKLNEQALRDSLTGLMNRLAIYQYAQAEMERSRRMSAAYSLIMMNIDGLMQINKQHGQVVGDDVLKVITRTVREKSRPYDGVGRWAGDRFLIVLPDTEGPDAEKIAERIIHGLKGIEFSIDGKDSLAVNLSAGVACVYKISQSSNLLDNLIQQAEQAMSAARAAGGNQVYMAFV